MMKRTIFVIIFTLLFWCANVNGQQSSNIIRYTIDQFKSYTYGYVNCQYTAYIYTSNTAVKMYITNGTASIDDNTIPGINRFQATFTIPVSPGLQSISGILSDSVGSNSTFQLAQNLVCNSAPSFNLTYVSPPVWNSDKYLVYFNTSFPFSRIFFMYSFDCNTFNPHYTAYLQLTRSSIGIFRAVDVDTPVLSSAPLVINCTIKYTDSPINPTSVSSTSIIINVPSLNPNVTVSNSSISLQYYYVSPLMAKFNSFRVSTSMVYIQTNSTYSGVVTFGSSLSSAPIWRNETHSLYMAYDYPTGGATLTRLDNGGSQGILLGNLTQQDSFANIILPPTYSRSFANNTFFNNITTIQLNQIEYFGKVNLYSIGGSNKGFPQYPFGYYKVGNWSRFNYKVSIASTKYVNTANIYLYCYWITYIPITYTNTLPIDTLPPKLQNITFKVLSNTYLVTIRVTDDLSGVHTFNFFNIEYQASTYLIAGDQWDGVYQINCGIPTDVMTLDQWIWIYDSAKNRAIYINYYGDTPTLIQIPKLLEETIQISDFTYFRFIPDYVDMSEGIPSNVTLLFNVTSPIMSQLINGYKPSITFRFKYQSSQPLTFTNGQWGYTDRMFRIDFTLPPHLFNGSLDYQLGAFNSLVSPLFIERFGDGANLKIQTGSISDMMPPIIPFIGYITSGSQIVSAGQIITSGFSVTVQDIGNGLNDGYIEIISDLDPQPYRFSFNSSTLVSGDNQTGVYSFPMTFNGDNCFTQTYYIGNLYLEDNLGYYGSFCSSPDQSGEPFNPIMEPYTNITFTVICDSNPMQVGFVDDLPVITDLNVQTPLIYIRSENRSVVIDVTIQSKNGVSLSSRHNPSVYLSDSSFRTLTMNQTSMQAINYTTAKYTFSADVPYGFSGFSPMTLSVFGIVDSLLNINGYSTADLFNSSFPYYINTSSKFSSPLISSSSSMNNIGGQLTVYGLGFGNVSDPSSVTKFYIDYSGSGTKYQQISLISLDTTLMIVNVNPTPSNQTISLRVWVDGVYSNQYPVTITSPPSSILNPPAPPVACKYNVHNVLCSAHGVCTQNGCECRPPYSGPDCSTTNTGIPTPNNNPNQPNVIITNEITSTNISVFGIREIDLSGVQVNYYPINDWNLTITNETGLSSYYYNYMLNGVTNITTAVQWFTQSRTISYAFENIVVPPFTVKYGITLDKYPFANKLNTLQVLMNVDFVINNQDQCKSNSYGLGADDSNDLQWIKMRVGDQSFYGQFLRKAVVDGRVLAIRNSRINSTSTSSVIAINIPYFKNSIYIDPYFSYLLETEEDETCTTDGKKSLTTIQIIGIAIGCGAAFILIIVAAIYFFKKRVKIHIGRDKSITLVSRK